jgi:serine/threonine-protein kinase
MGSVWLANHLTLHVRCAVKFMSSDSQVQGDASFRTRFEFEARAIAQLHSPHVVRILDYALVDDVPFIAMEYLQGEDLSARLSRVGRLDAATTYRIVSQVARGLGKAHVARLVHRDIKPENIFLAVEDDELETVKLLDFGVAKSSAYAVEAGTQAGALVGTPAYMSPEQVRGVREIDHRSDLWSLAVVTYQCLTGQLPFESQALGEMFAKIMYEPIPIPTAVAPWLTPEFDAWWARAASRGVEDRFASARELALALGEALAIPDLPAESGGTGRWLHLPSPSAPPVAMTQPPGPRSEGEPKPAYLTTTTRSALTRSLRGARQLIRSRSIVALATVAGVIAILVAIGLSGSPAGHPAIAAAPAPSPAPSAMEATPRAPLDAAPRPLAEQTPAARSVLVTDLPVARPDSIAKPASSRPPTPAPTTSTRSHDRSSTKAPNDVDFGI